MGRSYNKPMSASFLFYDRASMKFRLERNDAVATGDDNDAQGNRSRG
jgi:hypothetical protein